MVTHYLIFLIITTYFLILKYYLKFKTYYNPHNIHPFHFFLKHYHPFKILNFIKFNSNIRTNYRNIIYDFPINFVTN